MNHRARALRPHRTQGRDRISRVTLMLGLSEEDATSPAEHRHNGILWIGSLVAAHRHYFIIPQHMWNVPRSSSRRWRLKTLA